MAERIVIGPPRRSSLKGDGCVKRGAVAVSIGSSQTSAHAEVLDTWTAEEIEQAKREAEETSALLGWDD